MDMRTDTIIGHKDEAVVGKKLSESGRLYAYADKQIQAQKTGLSLYKDIMFR